MMGVKLRQWQGICFQHEFCEARREVLWVADPIGNSVKTFLTKVLKTWIMDIPKLDLLAHQGCRVVF